MRLIFDIETDNLLPNVSKIHCICVEDVDSDYKETFRSDMDGSIEKGITRLSDTTDELIGHNILGYDIPVLKKLYGFTSTNSRYGDTFILSQLFYGDRKELDFKIEGFNKKLIGSHSLNAWGERLNYPKIDYQGGFEQLTDEMVTYCEQDVSLTKKLFQFLESEMAKRIIDKDCILTEHDIAPILQRQETYGVLFDKDKAMHLLAKLQGEKMRLKQELQAIFKPRVVSLGLFTPKVSSRKFSTLKGAEFTKIKFEEYNPSSRQQTIDRLIKDFGWNPEEFTDKGNPSLDEDVLESLPFKELKPLQDYFTIDKRLGQIENGRQAWLKQVKEDGRIHGAIMQSGTVTRRMSHYAPNMAQVVASDKLYGKECRELFCVPNNKVMIGVDADSLEMRICAGYMKAFDGGAFIRTVLQGKKEEGTDMHTLNAQAYQVDKYENGRDCAKTLYYASLYGCKNPKTGLILLQYGIDLKEYHTDFENDFDGIKKWNDRKKKSDSSFKGFTDKYLECLVAGKYCNELYGERMPALPALRKSVLEKLKTQGYLKSLDGSKLICRSEHGALNTLFQSAGAIIMKKALAILDNELQRQGLKPVTDYEFILNVHDEWQLEVVDNENIIGIIKECAVKSIIDAGKYFKFPCPMNANVKVGKNWSETH